MKHVLIKLVEGKPGCVVGPFKSVQHAQAYAKWATDPFSSSYETWLVQELLVPHK